MTQTSFPSLVVRQDRTLVRAIHHSTRYALVEVTAPPARRTAVRPRVNVAFVIDRSGSMAGAAKLPLALDAVRQGIARLAPTDRFAVVAYDDQVELVAPAGQASPEHKRMAELALAGLHPRGSTDLGGGWLRGAEQVALELDAAGINRVLLLTDGLANIGMTDAGELAKHAAALRARGVATSTFGVGTDFDEGLLGAMADAGGGTFRYIESPAVIPAYIGAEVGELLEVTARRAELRVTSAGAGGGIQVEPIGLFGFQPQPGGGVVQLGDLVADQVVRFVVALTFPMGEVDRTIGLTLSLADADGALDASETLTWRYADNPVNDNQPRDRGVDRAVARAYADRALRDVVAMNREGRYEEARKTLLGVARRVRGYAHHDEVLRGIVAELEAAAEQWSMVQQEGVRKAQYAASTYAMKSRMAAAAPMRRSDASS